MVTSGMFKKDPKKTLFLVTVLSLSLLVTGCSNTNSSNSNSDNVASAEETTSSSNSLTLPEDFPTDIPIHPGEIVVSTATGESDSRTWVVEVLVDDLESARNKSVSDLKQANFALQEESGTGTNEYLATLKNTDYIIRLKVYLESDTGQKEVMYVVTNS